MKRAPDRIDVLQWSTVATNREAWSKAAALLKQAAAEWISQSSGPSGLAILQAVEHGSDALAIGLCLDAIAGAEAEASVLQREVLVRLEGRVGEEPLSEPAVSGWHDAAVAVLKVLEPVDARAALARADRLMMDLRATDLARFSPLLPSGLQKPTDGRNACLGSIRENPCAKRSRRSGGSGFSAFKCTKG